MRVSPITFQYNLSSSYKDFTPIPMRYNVLHDLEFDIIAERIRAENMKNQMTKKLAQLKNNINNFINSTKK